MKLAALVFGLALVAGSVLAACGSRVGQDGESPNVSDGVVKVAVANPHKPDYSGVFNWGLKVSNVDELFFVSGFAATDVAGTVQYPGDATAQTDFILRRIEAFIKENGYRTTDIIRFEITVTKDVPPDHFPAILDRLAEFFSGVEVKPAGGPWRIVHGLIGPEMLVELEFWLAR